MIQRRKIVAFLARIALVVGIAIAMFAAPASAQTVFTYTNAANGSINSTTPCTSPLVRTFSVGDVFTISDVDIGVFATHTWRGDMQITLQHPDGTRVQLVDGDINSISGDNFNVLLNDGGTQTVNTDSATGTHSTTAPPPFANDFSPNAPLSAFNGKSSSGTWRLEICDRYPSADNGTLQYAELYLTSAPTNFADLSLAKTVSNAAPANATAVSYTLTVSNSASSPLAASGVQVSDVLPAGFTFSSASGVGTYSDITGVWDVGNVPIGASRSITINGVVSATSGATITNTAEIIASSVPDSDSTVNNGVTGEDDFASVSFTVTGARVAGTPPTLVCPNGFSSFDWTGRTWPQGSTANNYTLTGVGAFNWSIVSPAGFMNIASLGGQHPVLTTAAQGVLSLSKAIDFANRDQIATTTITLGTAVDGAQFTIFDVDFASGRFADRVKVYGTYNGATVIPVLTNGIANYVIGNEAFGDAGAASADPDGNVVVTFNSPVDTIIVEYGNHSTAPLNPLGQAIQMSGGISICSASANLTVLKTSSILDDPINGATNPKAIPGARIQYCILVSNSGTSAAENVNASDTLPTDVTFSPGTIQSGLTCAGASTPEDDNSTGADESDPAGASFVSGVLSYLHTAVNGGTSAAVTFEATVN